MGGRGTVLGACLGALFMASLDNGMSLKNVPDFIQDIIKGGIWLPQLVSMLLEDSVTDLMQTCVLGIDVGTGGTRAVIIDGRGPSCLRLLKNMNLSHRPDWLGGAAAGRLVASHPGCRGQSNRAGRACKEQIACVGFSGQMHGAVLLDGAGEVVRPALIWCDVRTEKQCKDLIEQVGWDRLIQLTCNPPLANFTLTKLLWCARTKPENWKARSFRHVAKRLRPLSAHTGEKALTWPTRQAR